MLFGLRAELFRLRGESMFKPLTEVEMYEAMQAYEKGDKETCVRLLPRAINELTFLRNKVRALEQKPKANGQ